MAALILLVWNSKLLVHFHWCVDKRFIQDDGISSYAYGHYAVYATTSCAKQDADTGATAKVVELGVTVDDDAWLYIPYDN